MPLPNLLTVARERVPGCVAACVVDLERGELLESHAEPGARSAAELAAIAGPELSSGAWLIEEWTSGGEPRSLFEEVVVVAEDSLQVWLRASRDSLRALLLLCSPQTNLGMALVRARTLIPSLAEVIR